MILRRFMKHVSEQNWFAVGLDVLVVITGIFLGMQVTDWNEARKGASAEAEYLAALADDLGLVRQNVEDAIETHSELADKGLVALEYLNGETTVSDEKNVIANGMLYQHRLPFPQIRLGELGVILDRQIQVPVSDRSKRRAIIELVDDLSSLLEIYDHIILSIDEAHSLHLGKLAPPISRFVDGKVVTERRANIDVSALREDKVFQNSLQNMVSRHATSAFMLGSINKAIDKYLGPEQ